MDNRNINVTQNVGEEKEGTGQSRRIKRCCMVRIKEMSRLGNGGRIYFCNTASSIRWQW